LTNGGGGGGGGTDVGHTGNSDMGREVWKVVLPRTGLSQVPLPDSKHTLEKLRKWGLVGGGVRVGAMLWHNKRGKKIVLLTQKGQVGLFKENHHKKNNKPGGKN